MAIDYYLVDKRNCRIFEVGNHKMVFQRALRTALSMSPPPPLELFCFACAADAYARVETMPSAFVDPNPWLWAFDRARHAANLHDFCSEADWQVELVNDCDGSIDKYHRLPTTHSIYTRAIVI